MYKIFISFSLSELNEATMQAVSSQDEIKQKWQKLSSALGVRSSTALMERNQNLGYRIIRDWKEKPGCNADIEKLEKIIRKNGFEATAGRKIPLFYYYFIF